MRASADQAIRAGIEEHAVRARVLDVKDAVAKTDVRVTRRHFRVRQDPGTRLVAPYRAALMAKRLSFSTAKLRGLWTGYLKSQGHGQLCLGVYRIGTIDAEGGIRRFRSFGLYLSGEQCRSAEITCLFTFSPV